MPILLDIAWVLAGLFALYFGAEWLVSGSAKLAVRLGISPLVVGLTVVAFGTSSPELFVSFKFNLEGLADMAVGNVIGSNICNIGLILGFSALFYRLSVSRDLIVRDLPFLLISSGVFVWMIRDNQISRMEGGILTAGIVVYTVYCVLASKKRKNTELLKEYEAEFGEEVAKKDSVRLLVLLMVIGLVTLYFGAEWMKKGGVNIAVALGVPPAVISLTLVAFATSVPELATSVVAAIKREGDIITGNVIGSCIFNLLCVLGITASAKPMEIGEIQSGDLYTMLGLTVLLIPVFCFRHDIGRFKGLLLLMAYGAYLGWLYLTRIAA